MDKEIIASPKHHITATISENIFQELERYRNQHKVKTEIAPDRSQLIEDAIVLFLKINRKSY